jgi:hypothetical protein
MSRKCILLTICVVCLGYGASVFAAIPADYTGTPFVGKPLLGKPQRIPGDIIGVYFDMGGEGVAFHEQDNAISMVTPADRIRFDADNKEIEADKYVDTQIFDAGKDFQSLVANGQCKADTIKGHHIGWCEVFKPDDPNTQEWLKYTVHVDTAGKYTMDIHWSIDRDNDIFGVTFGGMKTDSLLNPAKSLSCNGMHELCHQWKWDDNVLTVTIPDTGLYVIKFQFLRGNSNFDRMRFRLKEKIVATQNPETKGFFTASGLDVKPSVSGKDMAISYSLNQAGPVTVSVFNCAGRASAPAIIKNLNAGRHTQSFGLSNMGTGVHFVRVEHNGVREIKSFTITR